MAALDTTSVSKPILSAYVASLDSQTKTRYVDKISTIGYIDPYVIPPNQFVDGDDTLPPLTYADLFVYLVITRSAYTHKQLKSYKGLESYNQFVSGWVRERTSKEIKGKTLVMARVSKLSLIISHTLYVYCFYLF